MFSLSRPPSSLPRKVFLIQQFPAGTRTRSPCQAGDMQPSKGNSVLTAMWGRLSLAKLGLQIVNGLGGFQTGRVWFLPVRFCGCGFIHIAVSC